METVIAERTLSQSSSEVVQVITRYIAWNTWDNNTYHDHERKHLDSSQEPGFFIRFPVHNVSRWTVHSENRAISIRSKAFDVLELYHDIFIKSRMTSWNSSELILHTNPSLSTFLCESDRTSRIGLCAVFTSIIYKNS